MHALVECFRSDGRSRTLTPHCRLKSKLAAAHEAFMRELDSATLAQCAYPAAPRRLAAAVDVAEPRGLSSA